MSQTAFLGRLRVGAGSPVRVMAAINASPESFYKGSVASTSREVASRVALAVREGADLVDIGGASTAPYLKTAVPEETEVSRVEAAIKAATEASDGRVALSVDTVRAAVAEAAIRGGAVVVNDVSGLKHDPEMGRVVRRAGVSLLAMAHASKPSDSSPIAQVSRALRETLRIAARAGIEPAKIVLDPGIGFFRGEPANSTTSHQDVMPWYQWDLEVVAGLPRLSSLGRPIGIGISRKSFIGKVLALERPEDRLAGSLALTAVAVANGARLVRTHDVRETVQAVRAVEAVLARKARRAP